jgi:hypothetical protein
MISVDVILVVLGSEKTDVNGISVRAINNLDRERRRARRSALLLETLVKLGLAMSKETTEEISPWHSRRRKMGEQIRGM